MRVRSNVLAFPKQEYQGKDFFDRSEFRGLLLADYQDACGQTARQSVKQLNQTTINNFKHLRCFQNSLSQQRLVGSFYKDLSLQQSLSAVASVNTFKQRSGSQEPAYFVNEPSQQYQSAKVIQLEPVQVITLNKQRKS